MKRGEMLGDSAGRDAELTRERGGGRRGAVRVSAASFAGSAALLARLPKRPPETVPDGTVRSRIAEELRWLLGNRLLRVVALVLGVSSFCNTMGFATLVLLVTETLKVGRGFYGVLLAAAAVGSVLGGLLNPWLTRRLGQVPGRVNSAYRMIGWGLMPVGAVVGGLVAHVAGLRAPYVIAGVLCGITTLAALPLLRE